MKMSEIAMLEEAYLSVSKKMTSTPNEIEDEESVTTEPNPVVSVGPMDEPAPGTEANVVDQEISDVHPTDKDTVGIPVSMSSDCGCGQTPCMCNGEQESEEDEMAIENLDSIRESIMKIASFCASGGHLEVWAQQKLAIAMDNLASVARSVRV